MDRRVRIALCVVAALLVVGVAFLVGRAAGGDNKDVATGATSTSTGVVGVSSTVVVATTVAPVTTGVPDTPVPPTPAPPAGTVVTAAGALLEQAPQPTLQSTNGPDSDCTTLGDSGWTLDGCAPVDMAGGTRVWLTEYRPAGAFKEWQAYVMHWSQGKGAWLIDLRLGQTMGIAQVNVRQLDLNGDGKADMVFGYHLTGSGSILAYDLVDGSGSPLAVAAARQLSHGRANAVVGAITDFEAKYPNGEPNCCPAYIQQSKVTNSSGAYRVIGMAQFDPATAPSAQPGDL